MNQPSKQVFSRVDSQLTSAIGNDSELFAKLNSAQREAISKIYSICNCYYRIWNNMLLEEEQSQTMVAPRMSAKKDNKIIARICTGACTIVSYFIGRALFPNIYGTGLVTLAGFLAGEFLSDFLFKDSDTSFAAPLSEPSSKNPSFQFHIEESVVDQAVEEIKRATETLMAQIEILLKPKELGYDISTDVSFAEWVQKIISVIQYVEDRQFKILVSGELVTILAGMGIRVYQDVRISESGDIITPFPDMFVVKKLGRNEKPEVTLPAVCYKDKVLAKGEIIQ